MLNSLKWILKTTWKWGPRIARYFKHLSIIKRLWSLCRSLLFIRNSLLKDSSIFDMREEGVGWGWGWGLFGGFFYIWIFFDVLWKTSLADEFKSDVMIIWWFNPTTYICFLYPGEMPFPARMTTILDLLFPICFVHLRLFCLSCFQKTSYILIENGQRPLCYKRSMWIDNKRRRVEFCFIITT